VRHIRNNRHAPGVQSFEVTRAGLSQHDVSQWRAIMFDQIVGEKTARKPFAVAVSISGQAVVLGLAILVPLLHTEAVTAGRLIQVVPLKPWGGPQHVQQKPVTGRTPAKPGLRLFSERALLQPARIPQTVTMIDDGPIVQSIAGSAAFSGSSDGVFGLVPTEVAPPPKPAAQQPPAQRTEVAPLLPVRIGGIVQAAKLLRQVKPIYPPLAKQARISGDVRLEAVISRDGTVASLQLISGHPLLAPAAVEAVRQWLYRPTTLNGEPVEVLTQIEVHFKLGE
jgi:protein TonB